MSLPRHMLLIAATCALPLGACAQTSGQPGYNYAQGSRSSERYANDRYANDRYANDRYERDRSRADREQGRNDRNRRANPSYAMGSNDRVYRDANGRYYCKKPDGTTGAIVGAVAGGLLGNAIAGRGDKTLGAIIGAAGGALAGQAIEKGQVRCE